MFVVKLATDVADPSAVVVNTCNPGATKVMAFLVGIDLWVVRKVMNGSFANKIYIWAGNCS